MKKSYTTSISCNSPLTRVSRVWFSRAGRSTSLTMRRKRPSTKTRSTTNLRRLRCVTSSWARCTVSERISLAASFNLSTKRAALLLRVKMSGNSRQCRGCLECVSITPTRCLSQSVSRSTCKTQCRRYRILWGVIRCKRRR